MHVFNRVDVGSCSCMHAWQIIENFTIKTGKNLVPFPSQKSCVKCCGIIVEQEQSTACSLSDDQIVIICCVA